MTTLLHSVLHFFELIVHGDIKSLVQFIGYPGVLFAIFSESGLLLGFFLPGDSLLFTAGLLASPKFGFINIWSLIIGAWIAAVLGDNVGYEFGKRVGRNLFKKEKSFLFNPTNLMRAQDFYEKNGGKAIVLARFMPIIRTFAPVVAGISHMDHKKFTFFNFIGGTLWVWAVSLAGYFLGSVIPNIDKYILPVVVIIILASTLPPIYHFYRESHKSLGELFKEKVLWFFKYKL